jgi:hypothetical protein
LDAEAFTDEQIQLSSSGVEDWMLEDGEAVSFESLTKDEFRKEADAQRYKDATIVVVRRDDIGEIQLANLTQIHGLGQLAMLDIKSKIESQTGSTQATALSRGKSLATLGFGVDVIEQVQKEMETVNNAAESQVKTIVRTDGDARVALIKIVVKTVAELDEVHSLLHGIFPRQDRAKSSFGMKGNSRKDTFDPSGRGVRSASGAYDWRKDLQVVAKRVTMLSRKSAKPGELEMSDLRSSEVIPRRKFGGRHLDEHGANFTFRPMVDEEEEDAEARHAREEREKKAAEEKAAKESENQFIREYATDLVEDQSLSLPAKLKELSDLAFRGELSERDFDIAKQKLLGIKKDGSVYDGGVAAILNHPDLTLTKKLEKLSVLREKRKITPEAFNKAKAEVLLQPRGTQRIKELTYLRDLVEAKDQPVAAKLAKLAALKEKELITTNQFAEAKRRVLFSVTFKASQAAEVMGDEGELKQDGDDSEKAKQGAIRRRSILAGQMSNEDDNEEGGGGDMRDKMKKKKSVIFRDVDVPSDSETENQPNDSSPTSALSMMDKKSAVRAPSKLNQMKMYRSWDLIPSGSVRVTVAIGDCTTWQGIEDLDVDAVVEASPELAHDLENTEHGHPALWVPAENDQDNEDDDANGDDEDLRSSLGGRVRGSVELMKSKTSGVVGLINRWKNKLSGKDDDDDNDEEAGVRRCAKILVAPPHLATKAASFSAAPNQDSTSASAISAAAPVEFLQAHAAAHMALVRLAAENSADVIAIPLNFLTEVSSDLLSSLEELALIQDEKDNNNDLKAMSGGQEVSLDDALSDEKQQRKHEHQAKILEQARAKMSTEVLLENAVRAMRRVVYDINMPKRITQEADSKKREIEELRATLARATLDKELLETQLASIPMNRRKGLARNDSSEWSWSGGLRASEHSTNTDINGLPSFDDAVDMLDDFNTAEKHKLEERKKKLREAEKKRKKQLEEEEEAKRKVEEEEAQEEEEAKRQQEQEDGDDHDVPDDVSEEILSHALMSKAGDESELIAKLEKSFSLDDDDEEPVQDDSAQVSAAISIDDLSVQLVANEARDAERSSTSSVVSPSKPRRKRPSAKPKSRKSNSMGESPIVPTSGDIPVETSVTPELPAGWVSRVDESTGATYYYNNETKETSWVVPDATAVITTPVAETLVAAASPELPAGWVSRVDETTGATYYYNNETKETSWVVPDVTVTVDGGHEQSEL